MCFTNQRYQAPSIRASLDPLTGTRDAAAVLTGGKRQGDTDPLNLAPKKPQIPELPAMPQSAKAPSTTPLRRRSVNGIAVPAGSTWLSDPSGIGAAQLNLGSQTLLGGG